MCPRRSCPDIIFRLYRGSVVTHHYEVRKKTCLCELASIYVAMFLSLVWLSMWSVYTNALLHLLFNIFLVILNVNLCLRSEMGKLKQMVLTHVKSTEYGINTAEFLGGNRKI